jgi:Protein of unknown function (DUF1648)
MAPRDRDSQRPSPGRYSESEWDDYAAEDEYAAANELPYDPEGEELVDWQGRPSRPATSSRSSARPQETYPYDTNPEPAPRRQSTSALPELSRNFQRGDQYPPAQRGAGKRPVQAPSTSRYELPAEPEEWALETEWEAEEVAFEDEYYENDYSYAPPRRRAGSSRNRSRSRPAPRPPSITVPPAIGAAIAAQDRSVLGLLGVATGGILLMTLVLASRLGNLPDVLPIHLDASGAPDLWGTKTTLWRIPLAVTMITLINAVTAWYLTPRDPFAARFLIGSALLAQVIAWIALFLLLW